MKAFVILVEESEKKMTSPKMKTTEERERMKRRSRVSEEIGRAHV